MLSRAWPRASWCCAKGVLSRRAMSIPCVTVASSRPKAANRSGGAEKVDPPERGHVRAGLGIGAGVEGGRTRRPSLGDLGTPYSLIGRAGPAVGSKESAKFFCSVNQGLKRANRAGGGSGNGESGGDRGGAHRSRLGHGVRARRLGRGALRCRAARR